MRYRSFLLIMSAVGLVAGLGAGTAYAYFTSTGRGTGPAATGTLQTVTVAAATAAPGTALLPGGTSDVTLKVTNPNSYAVTLVGVTGTGGTITADGGHPGCTTTGVTFTGQTGLNTTIPASSTTTIDLPGAASMSQASSAGCQGATFSIPVTIAVQKR
jgi:predicted ribosomally synthesized peptide with SipW-like signal peptide